MEKINCHQLLDFKKEDLIADFNFVVDRSNPFSVQRSDPKLFLKPDIYTILSKLGNLTSLVFYMKPLADKGNIHIDLEASTKLPLWPSFNILIEGQGIMKWFKPESNGIMRYSPKGKVFYRSWEKEYGEIIDEWSEGKVALVRTDLPHNSWNYDSEDRLVVSVRWETRLTWNETLDWFNTNLKNI